MIPLALIIGYVVMRGWSALTVNFFTKVPAGPLNPSEGGIVQSFIGTLIITGLAARDLHPPRGPRGGLPRGVRTG